MRMRGMRERTIDRFELMRCERRNTEEEKAGPNYGAEKPLRPVPCRQLTES